MTWRVPSLRCRPDETKLFLRADVSQPDIEFYTRCRAVKRIGHSYLKLDNFFVTAPACRPSRKPFVADDVSSYWRAAQPNAFATR
jgi:hypothetical protein